MDYHLKGHPYVKSPLDMAFWDIPGKAAGMSVSTLLGGREQDEVSKNKQPQKWSKRWVLGCVKSAPNPEVLTQPFPPFLYVFR